MQIRDYTSKDLAQLNHWLKKHKQAPITQDAVPVLTFLVPGVAIASIRLVEGHVGMLDNMVTNPHVSAQTRHKALQALYGHIKLKTEQLKLKHLLGFTYDTGAHSRAVAEGFRPLPISCLIYAKDN